MEGRRRERREEGDTGGERAVREKEQRGDEGNGRGRGRGRGREVEREMERGRGDRALRPSARPSGGAGEPGKRKTKKYSYI